MLMHVYNYIGVGILLMLLIMLYLVRYSHRDVKVSDILIISMGVIYAWPVVLFIAFMMGISYIMIEINSSITTKWKAFKSFCINNNPVIIRKRR